MEKFKIEVRKETSRDHSELVMVFNPLHFDFLEIHKELTRFYGNGDYQLMLMDDDHVAEMYLIHITEGGKGELPITIPSIRLGAPANV